MKPQATKEANNVQPNQQKQKVFPIAQLRKNCLDLFGVTLSTFDGATHDVNSDHFTLEEMNHLIKVWGEKRLYVTRKEMIDYGRRNV